MHTYRTIEEQDDRIETLYEIQKSKFITHLAHVESEDAAREFIQAMKKRYFDARHNCSAYVLGENSAQQKSNDDGEPGGTAGNPILEAIKKNGLTNIVVVVTRYFGGIKLGAGGLIRAYSHAAVCGIAAATVLEMTPFAELAVTIDYDLLAACEHYQRQNNIRSAEADYSDNVTLNLLVPPADAESVTADLTNLTAGRAKIKQGAEKLFAMPVSI
ncbi:MAG: YigZ family protein [Selenomonas sp.]|nr:YigZ family protein [Selenomonas sp.]